VSRRYSITIPAYDLDEVTRDDIWAHFAPYFPFSVFFDRSHWWIEFNDKQQAKRTLDSLWNSRICDFPFQMALISPGSLPLQPEPEQEPGALGAPEDEDELADFTRLPSSEELMRMNLLEMIGNLVTSIEVDFFADTPRVPPAPTASSPPPSTLPTQGAFTASLQALFERPLIRLVDSAQPSPSTLKTSKTSFSSGRYFALPPRPGQESDGDNELEEGEVVIPVKGASRNSAHRTDLRPERGGKGQERRGSVDLTSSSFSPPRAPAPHPPATATGRAPTSAITPAKAPTAALSVSVKPAGEPSRPRPSSSSSPAQSASTATSSPQTQKISSSLLPSKPASPLSSRLLPQKPPVKLSPFEKELVTAIGREVYNAVLEEILKIHDGVVNELLSVSLLKLKKERNKEIEREREKERDLAEKKAAERRKALASLLQSGPPKKSQGAEEGKKRKAVALSDAEEADKEKRQEDPTSQKDLPDKKKKRPEDTRALKKPIVDSPAARRPRDHPATNSESSDEDRGPQKDSKSPSKLSQALLADEGENRDGLTQTPALAAPPETVHIRAESELDIVGAPSLELRNILSAQKASVSFFPRGPARVFHHLPLLLFSFFLLPNSNFGCSCGVWGRISKITSISRRS